MKIRIPKRKTKQVNPAWGNVVPKKFDDFLVDMNFPCAYGNSSAVFHGRDKEVNRIFNSFLKTNNNNVILLGERGTGKTITLQIAVDRVVRSKCPKELFNNHFIYVDLEAITAALSSGEKDIVKLLADMFTFLLKYNNIVVVMDEIHLVATSSLLIYYLSLITKSNTTKLIGMTTEENFEDFFYYHDKMRASMDIITIEEPRAKKIYPMICDYVKYLGELHNVTISEDLVNYTISVSNAFSSEMCNPGLAVDFIEKSMIVAKRRKHNKVTKKDVNSNFNFNYELYNQMSEDYKLTTAYHEAGHFLVGKLSKNIKDWKTTAVTIVPAEDFLGVTLFDFEPENQINHNSDYFIDQIAMDLAGRVAELILQGKEDDEENSQYTSGAVSDLKNATATARAIITEFGMIKSCGANRTYFCNFDLSDLALLSEESKTKINEEMEKLIEEAYNRAKNVLLENRELLDLIARELIKNDVLDEKDLDRLCASVLEKE